MGKLFSKYKAIDKKYFQFIKMHVCHSAITNILAVFLGAFILKADGSDGGVNRALLYYIIAYGAQPFFMVLASIAARKLTPLISQRIGLCTYVACFLFVIIFAEKAATYFFIIALLVACSAGFYYVTYSWQIIEYTSDDNRDLASGFSSTLGYIIAFVFPLLSGVLLKAFPDSFTGYRILFGVLCLIAATAFIMSAKYLSPLTAAIDPADKKIHVLDTAKVMLRGKTERLVLTMTVIKGFRSGTMNSLLEILIYSKFKDEFLVGLNSSLGKGCAILGAMVYGFVVTKKHRGRTIQIAASIIILTVCLLFFNMSIYVLLLFSAVNNLLGLFITEPSQNLYFSTITCIEGLRGHAGEVHTVNEFFLALGEVSGLFATIIIKSLWPSNDIAYIIAIIILTASQFLCGLLVNVVSKRLEDNVTE